MVELAAIKGAFGQMVVALLALAKMPVELQSAGVFELTD
jgi:hypothetical protein